MFRISPCLEHKGARRFQDADDRDLTLRLSISVILNVAHFVSPEFVIRAGNHQADQASVPTIGD
ncbi:MAG: hypothetical protein ACYT04_95865, partial [Nostoc sp.]